MVEGAPNDQRGEREKTNGRPFSDKCPSNFRSPRIAHQRLCTNLPEQIISDREEVIQAWYMDDSDEDQRLPHHKEPQEFVSLQQLEELGVLSWRLDADNYENDEELKKIREAHGYSYMDFCEVCPEKLPNYDEKIKNFFEEHLHTDEEIRYCVAGSGYFDVRDRNDKWIRIWVKKGGMIAMRLFVGDPVWTPHNRPNDDLPARKEYVANFVHKETSKQAVDAAA
ncbi:hypothetical protein Cgig2_014968 [Carnegiea gigantea]|uniref:Probable inactive acireductone dioxygenase n=1 Tax=Carnegiea gigantea TaxID=171969 RepID=A0A9Q1GNR4_9CARY|nr:hypothetical protein Cgig2_014968 [Carnegiea gigantea]